MNGAIPLTGIRPDAGASRLVAVVELGTTSIRMTIAQVAADNSLDTLESLQQAVSLGKDTFTSGVIETGTTEECVKALRSFKQILAEYRVPAADTRVVATSAVREAANRESFVDRILIATGMYVRVLDDSEVNRYTYLAVHPVLAREKILSEGYTVAVEVGGGSTEALVFHDGKVVNSHSYSLGSLRLRSTFEEYEAPVDRLLKIVRNQIARSVQRIAQEVSVGEGLNMLAIGGDIRFACTMLVEEWNNLHMARLDVRALSTFTEKTVNMSVDEVVKKRHVSYPDAETLGPALLVYASLARTLRLKHIFVGKPSLREGILAEMAAGGAWSNEFREQVISSAKETGAKYDFDREHAEIVADAAAQLFNALRDEHGLNPRYELILTVAALLHEIGCYVSDRAHHKHSMYLILNSDIFGLGAADLVITALVARYHRRAAPKPTHELYQTLERENRVIVAKLAAMLRVADAICRGHRQKRQLHIEVEPGTMAIGIERTGDLTLEQHALREKGKMFERTFGMDMILRRYRGSRKDGKIQIEIP